MFKYKEFRRAHSLFQSQLAEIIGMTQSNLSRYETEGIDPTREQYEKLYARYGKEDVDAFVIEEGMQMAASNNVNGSGVQNNGIQSDKELVGILKNLTETLSEHVKKQDQMAEQMMALLQKLALK